MRAEPWHRQRTSANVQCTAQHEACRMRHEMRCSYLHLEPGPPPPVVPGQHVGARDDGEGALAVGRRDARHQ